MPLHRAVRDLLARSQLAPAIIIAPGCASRPHRRDHRCRQRETSCANQTTTVRTDAYWAFVLPLALLGSLIPVASVSAAVGITGATGGSTISADTNSTTGTGAYTTLIGPAIQEGGAGDLAIGSLVLNRPAGFEFNPGSASASAGGVGCAGMVVGAVVTTATTVTIPITAPSTAACTLSVSGLQVRPTVGTPLSSGNITNTGTIGPTPGNYGTLTEIPGAPDPDVHERPDRQHHRWSDAGPEPDLPFCGCGGQQPRTATR